MSVETGEQFQWCRFFGSYNNATAADEMYRMQRQLTHGFDSVNLVLQNLSGSPSGETEETLRIARTAIAEALDEIESIARKLRYSAALDGV